MKSNISLVWLAITTAGVGIVCAMTTIILLRSDMLGSYPIEGTPIVASAAMIGIPVQLIIPVINIDTTIAPAGVTADGAMAVPVGPTSTTWFDLGPRPGEIGSAVIAGHEGWKDGISAIFDDLHTLQPGDKIYVVDGQGATTPFVVRVLRLYGQYESSATVFNSSDGKAHLNLITCEGVWNAAEKSYPDRLVVFADEATTL